MGNSLALGKYELREELTDFAVRVAREVNIRTQTFSPDTLEEEGWAYEGMVRARDLTSVCELSEP